MTSARRFDIGSSDQPILQFIATSIPFLVLCLWFLYSAHRRPNIDCYQQADLVNDDGIANSYSQECSQYVPLRQFLIVFFLLAFLSGLLVAYLLIYVPRRHRLIQEYLQTGKIIIGDVYYNRQKRGVLFQPAYGNAVYTHPETGELLRRQVRVFERYTRERAAILILPNQPYSGQPKLDLEIDREVTELNQSRFKILSYYAIGWLVFTLVAPIYIVEIMRSVDNNENPSPWQPDINIHNFPSWYYLASFVFLPIGVMVWTMITWLWHQRWMTYQHKVLNNDGVVAVYDGSTTGNRCCFDDEDCESIEIKDYQPPNANTVVCGDDYSKTRENGATV